MSATSEPEEPPPSRTTRVLPPTALPSEFAPPSGDEPSLDDESQHTQRLETDRGNLLAGPVAGAGDPGPAASPATDSADREYDPRIGKKLGRFEIKRLIGRGGMGVVYEADDPALNRKVAIKLLSELKASDPESQARFLREARAVGQLNHPNIVTIHEINDAEPDRYLVLEYVDGGSLAEAIRDSPLPWQEAVRDLEQICRGLSVAHQANLIHRDIKPANMLRSKQGEVKLTDFGLAKQVDRKDNELTNVNRTLGTPSFMSPEQCHAQRLDARSDIYGLGASLYALLTGHGPFDDQGSSPAVMMGHCYKPIPDPREAHPEIPEELSRIINRAMAKKPGDRYQSVEALRQDLVALLSDSGGGPRTARDQHVGFDDFGESQVGPIVSLLGRREVLLTLTAGSLALGYSALTLFRNRSGAREHGNPAAGGAAIGSGKNGPIRIGLLASTSGTLRSAEAGTIQGVNLAVAMLNDQGGLLGRRVEVVPANGRSRPGVFADAAERLIRAEDVDALFGCWSSPCRKAVKEVVEREQNLLFYPAQFEGLELSPSIVYVGTTANQHILPALEWCLSMGRRRFYLVGSDSIYPRAAGVLVKEYLARLGGTLVGEAYIPLARNPRTDLFALIEKAAPDMLLNFITGDSNLEFFRARHGAGLDATRLPCASFALTSGTIESVGSELLVDDYLVSSYFDTIDQTASTRFVSDFQAFRHSREVPGATVQAAYACVRLWAEAVEKAGDTEPHAVREALAGLRIIAPEGPIRVDPDTRYCSRHNRIARIGHDGRLQVVFKPVQAIDPVVFPTTLDRPAWEAMLEGYHQLWKGRWQADSFTATMDVEP